MGLTIIPRLSLATLVLSSAVLSATIPSSAASEEWRFSFTPSKRALSTAYKSPPQSPPLFNDSPTSITENAHNFCNSTAAVVDKIVATVSVDNATFPTVVLPMLEQENNVSLYTSILAFYQYVSADVGLRDASTQADDTMQSCSIDLGAREDIFRLVDRVYSHANTSVEKLDPESQRAVLKMRKEYTSSGLSLPAGSSRDHYKALRTQIAQLEIQFSRNFNEENGSLWFSASELDGVSADFLNSLEKGTGENAGKLRVTFKRPDLDAVFTSAKSGETRKKMWIGSENRSPENVPLLKQAIALRDEAARLLGYANHAAFQIEDRMAHDPATVNNFLADLRSRLAKRGISDADHLGELKKDDCRARNLTCDSSVYLWDKGYYERILQEKEYNVDEKKISEYFPVQHTVEAMLHVYEDLFGLTFVELTAEDRDRLSPTGKGRDLVWHEDVIFFSVWDTDSENKGQNDTAPFLGYLYMDLHPRPGKYTHAANFNIQPGFVNKDGKSRHYPATSLVCNLSKPTADKPALLSHDEVITLFHELGHGIHNLAGRTTYSRFHGTSVVRDFVEAPSQMLENWCWTPSTLKRLSSHFKTGESLPDDLIEKLISTKHVDDGLYYLRQLAFGIFDMTIHSPKTHDDVLKMDPGVVYNQVLREVSQLKTPEDLGMPSTWGHGEASFPHMMGGYDAGYYGYLWSLVYSTDMFYTAFKANPMDPVVGRKYRHTVLEKGGSQDEELTLEQFLGRKPSTEAFYKELGI